MQPNPMPMPPLPRIARPRPATTRAEPLPLTIRQPLSPLPDPFPPPAQQQLEDALRRENRETHRRLRAAEDRFNRLLLALIALGLVAAATLLVVRLSTGG